MKKIRGIKIQGLKGFTKQRKVVVLVGGCIALVLVAMGIYFLFDSTQKDVSQPTKQQSTVVEPPQPSSESVEFSTVSEIPVHPASGALCKNSDNPRPVAFMLAADSVARPLSGIAYADIVVEMPVIKGGITRFMAIFSCEPHDESIALDIGSIRSSRHDFIPVAASFDAIYAHWGGSKYALQQINRRVIDNLNGLTNPHNTYFRKQGILAPHNGFSSYERAQRAANELGYRSQYQGHEYTFVTDSPQAEADGSTLRIGYGRSYDVFYAYSSETNTYTRHRNNKPEIDARDRRSVEAKKVAVLFTTSRMIDNEYNDVDVEGQGTLLLFQNGDVIEGSWQKAETSLNSPILFFDEDGEEIRFVTGALWIQYVDVGTTIEWEGVQL